MPFDIWMSLLENMQVMAALPIGIPGKKLSTNYAKFTLALISERFEFSMGSFYVIKIIHFHHKIQDGFGLDAWDGCAANMINADYWEGKTHQKTGHFLVC